MSDNHNDGLGAQKRDKYTPLMAGGAMREQGKIPYNLVPPEFNGLLALVLEYGVHKYSERNYEKGLPPQDLLRGAESHLIALKSGELNDSESGLPHAAHAAWNMLTFAMQMMRNPHSETIFRDSVAAYRKDAADSFAMTMYYMRRAMNDHIKDMSSKNFDAPTAP